MRGMALCILVGGPFDGYGSDSDMEFVDTGQDWVEFDFSDSGETFIYKRDRNDYPDGKVRFLWDKAASLAAMELHGIPESSLGMRIARDGDRASKEESEAAEEQTRTRFMVVLNNEKNRWELRLGESGEVVAVTPRSTIGGANESERIENAKAWMASVLNPNGVGK